MISSEQPDDQADTEDQPDFGACPEGRSNDDPNATADIYTAAHYEKDLLKMLNGIEGRTLYGTSEQKKEFKDLVRDAIKRFPRRKAYWKEYEEQFGEAENEIILLRQTLAKLMHARRSNAQDFHELLFRSYIQANVLNKNWPDNPHVHAIFTGLNVDIFGLAPAERAQTVDVGINTAEMYFEGTGETHAMAFERFITAVAAIDRLFAIHQKISPDAENDPRRIAAITCLKILAKMRQAIVALETSTTAGALKAREIVGEIGIIDGAIRDVRQLFPNWAQQFSTMDSWPKQLSFIRKNAEAAVSRITPAAEPHPSLGTQPTT